MVKSFVNTIFLLLISLQSIAQPGIQWQKSFGGSSVDGCNSVASTPDGGYIFAGYSCSTDGQVTGNHGGADCWVIKTDDTGAIQWEKSYGGSGDDVAYFIENDINGGYMLGCATTSNDGDVSGNHGGWDAWIVKIDDTGAIVWQRLMGTSGYDFVNNPINTIDSGYIVVGSAGANDGDVTGFRGGSNDVWVISLSKTGALLWDKVYGTSATDYGLTIGPATGGGYIISAQAGAGDGDVTEYYGGYADAWIIRIDDTGAIKWQKTYGGSDYDQAVAVLPAPGGGYVFSGCTASNNGLVTGLHGSPGVSDIWMVRINDTGGLLWENCFGGSGDEYAFNMLHASDGSFVVAGITDENSQQVSGAHGGVDFWIIDVDTLGTLIWQECLGGSGNDTVGQIIQTSDSGFVVVGSTTSMSGQATVTYGVEDYWAVKLKKPNPTSELTKTHVIPSVINVFPTVTSDLVHVTMPDGYENARIEVINTMGQKVRENIDNNSLNRLISFGGMPDGTYILQVINNNETNFFKILRLQ